MRGDDDEVGEIDELYSELVGIRALHCMSLL